MALCNVYRVYCDLTTNFKMNLSQEEDIINNEGLEKSTSMASTVTNKNNVLLIHNNEQILGSNFDTINNAHSLYGGRFFKLISIDSKSKIKTECQLCVPKTTRPASTTATSNLKRHLKVSFHFRFCAITIVT